jgi:hypothetical protein
MKQFFNLVFIALAIQGYSQDFHVTTSGDDDAPGNSSLPWGSIQHAMDNATPGSTVHIHGGTYNERLYVNVDGTAGNYITFIAYNEEEVIVDGGGMTDNALIEMYDVQYVAIEGLKIRNNVQLDAVGILIEGVSDHIRIEDCDISEIHFSSDPNAAINENTNAQALIVYGNESAHAITDLEIIDNEIFDCRLGYSEALAVNGNVDGFLISENEVHDITNIGIDIIGHEGTCDDPLLDQARNGVISDNETYNCLSPYATSAGIYVDGGKDLIIERNHVHHNQWGIEIGCENIGKSTDNVIVRNNFLYRNATAGLHMGGYDYPTGSGKLTNCKVINNTFFGNDTENDYSGELYLSYNENLEVRNNIFYADNANGAMMSDENLATQSTGMVITANAWFHPLGNGNIEWAYEGNYYESLEAFQVGTGFAQSLTWENPQFENLGNQPNLHLTAATGGSIVDSGDSSPFYGDTDIDGENRVAGLAVDIGADEYGSSVGLNEADDIAFGIYPNPASSFLIIDLSSTDDVYIIRITDLRGVRLQERTIRPSGLVRFELDHLSAGMYLIQIIDSNGLATSKPFMIE